MTSSGSLPRRSLHRVWIVCLLLLGSVALPASVGAQSEPCDGLIFRLNESSLKHVGVSAAIFGVSRVAGLSTLPAFGITMGANLAKEVTDPCFDAADIMSGAAGALMVMGLERLFGSSGFRSERGVELQVVPHPYPLRLRIPVSF